MFWYKVLWRKICLKTKLVGHQRVLLPNQIRKICVNMFLKEGLWCCGLLQIQTATLLSTHWRKATSDTYCTN